jgi:hypothetical protein
MIDDVLKNTEFGRRTTKKRGAAGNKTNKKKKPKSKPLPENK